MKNWLNLSAGFDCQVARAVEPQLSDPVARRVLRQRVRHSQYKESASWSDDRLSLGHHPMVAVQLLQPRLIVQPSHCCVERYSIGPSPRCKALTEAFSLLQHNQGAFTRIAAIRNTTHC